MTSPYSATAAPMIHVISLVLMASRPASASVDRPDAEGKIALFHARRYQYRAEVATSGAPHARPWLYTAC
jgi:hypothetical protein